MGTVTSQYMSRSQLQILVQLAKIDGVVSQDEIDLIRQVGKANGLTEEDIAAAFDETHEVGNLEDLSDDEKYEYMYRVVQLMKIDGRLYKEEITYCAKMASKMGYNEDVLYHLITKIYSDPHVSADKEALKKKVQKYLIKD
jgi:hypothetical protein